MLTSRQLLTRAVRRGLGPKGHVIHCCPKRFLASQSTGRGGDNHDYEEYVIDPCHGLWIAGKDKDDTPLVTKWGASINSRSSDKDKEKLVHDIEEKETKDRLRRAPPQSGVYKQDFDEDVQHMVRSFTGIELAAGLRGYDHLLQVLARNLLNKEYKRMAKLLQPYQKSEMLRGRCKNKPRILDKGESIEDGICVGVYEKDRDKDIDLLAQNYTAYALAQGIRTRSERIQFCAELHRNKDFEHLLSTLKPFEAECIREKRYKDHQIDWREDLERADRTLIRKVLTALPRRVGLAHQKRSAVVIPLCTVFGVPSVLFQVRAENISFPGDVCFPGGVVEATDKSTLYTAVREMEEEIKGFPSTVEVIAGLRCPWEEVQGFTSERYAVTPVVGWLGEIGGARLRPSPSEAPQLFSLPIKDLLDDSLWIRERSQSGPIFLGGPREIYGLTGYLLDEFVHAVLKPLAKR